MARKKIFQPALPTDPIERAATVYQRATTALKFAWQGNDSLWSGKTASGLRKGVMEDEWNASLAAVEKAQVAMFKAYDVMRRVEAHALEKQFASIEDLRAIISDTIAPNLDGIQFNVNFGLLASKVAQTIHHDSVEDEVGDPPLCEACV